MTQILVVDDEAAIREVLIEFLSDHGYAVQGAADGREALRMAKSLRPQVVLLDIAMPGMNGIETLKRLRQEDGHAAVIMISGHADHDQALQALDLGAFDFIQKPLDFRYLERTLLAKIVTLEPEGDDHTTKEGGGERGRSTGQRLR
jgi:two-component system, NtrC family, nitrogen regulation response regulator NtrX